MRINDGFLNFIMWVDILVALIFLVKAAALTWPHNRTDRERRPWLYHR